MDGRLNTQAGFQRIIEVADGDAAHDAPSAISDAIKQ
jgi:hypothetical protein